MIEGKELETKSQRKPRDYNFGLFSVFSREPGTYIGEKRETADSARRQKKKQGGRRAENENFQPQKTPVAGLSEEQQKIVAAIAQSNEGVAHIDDIVVASGFPAAQALSMLTELELEGVIEALPGKHGFRL